jgi:hypothetical protein
MVWERAPFEDCPMCRAINSFGILSAGGDVLTRRCKECRYSDSEVLPNLNKKVIYLDQFCFSEIHKERNGQRRHDNRSSFWKDVSELLRELVLAQQAILPHSNIHHDETIVSHFARELRDTQEHVGGDIELCDTDQVQLSQVEVFVKAFIEASEPKITFVIDDILRGHRNNWLPSIRVAVGMNWSAFADAKRRDRAKIERSVAGLIKYWRSNDYGFDEVLDIELGAYFQSRSDAFALAIATLGRGIENNDIFAGPNFAQSYIVRENDVIEHYLRKAGTAEREIAHKMRDFWQWDKNKDQPFGKILAYLFASLADQFKKGRKSMPSAGLMNDIKAISAYAPYVDAMFVDKECAQLLRHPRCRANLQYKAQIFSLANRNEFLNYLRQLISSTPTDVRKFASIIYGI